MSDAEMLKLTARIQSVCAELDNEAHSHGHKEHVATALFRELMAQLAEPVKVKPLVWEGNIAQNGMGGRYVIDWYDAGDLCTRMTFHSFGVPSAQEYIAGDTFAPNLKEAANAHHAARIREALE